MSQVSILPVQTAVSYVGSNIAIRTFYSAGSYSYVFIANAPGSLFGTPYVEGELVAVVPTGTAMYLNVAGELIINALEFCLNFQWLF